MANNGTLASRTFAGVSITALAQQAALSATFRSRAGKLPGARDDHPTFARRRAKTRCNGVSKRKGHRSSSLWTIRAENWPSSISADSISRSRKRPICSVSLTRVVFFVPADAGSISRLGNIAVSCIVIRQRDPGLRHLIATRRLKKNYRSGKQMMAALGQADILSAPRLL
jgi:hypothetical protein